MASDHKHLLTLFYTSDSKRKRSGSRWGAQVLSGTWGFMACLMVKSISYGTGHSAMRCISLDMQMPADASSRMCWNLRSAHGQRVSADLIGSAGQVLKKTRPASTPDYLYSCLQCPMLSIRTLSGIPRTMLRSGTAGTSAPERTAWLKMLSRPSRILRWRAKTASASHHAGQDGPGVVSVSPACTLLYSDGETPVCSRKSLA